MTAAVLDALGPSCPDAPALPVELLRPVLAAGLRWLYDTPQPDGAVMQHHGVMMFAPRINRRIDLVPRGFTGRAVIIVEVLRKTHRYPHIRRSTDGPERYELANGYAVGEADRIRALLDDLGTGGPVADAWNGAHRGWSGSFALTRPAGQSADPVARYRERCPEHDTVFCGRRDGCTWYADGRALVTLPDCPEGVTCR